MNIYYNREARTDDCGNKLEANTLYFSNHHYSINYKFLGSVGASGQISASKFISILSILSSSSASCNAGEFKDDVNYHYVCVAVNKWKRVALSDF